MLSKENNECRCVIRSRAIDLAGKEITDVGDLFFCTPGHEAVNLSFIFKFIYLGLLLVVHLRCLERDTDLTVR